MNKTEQAAREEAAKRVDKALTNLYRALGLKARSYDHDRDVMAAMLDGAQDAVMNWMPPETRAITGTAERVSPVTVEWDTSKVEAMAAEAERRKAAGDPAPFHVIFREVVKEAQQA